MTRPLRIEFPGALYHVTARGDQSNAIYRDDTDRYIWLDVLGLVCARFHLVVHAYCQMTNHYHLMLETAEGNLGQGMRQLNGIYSQRHNRRHDMVGHVFQGRYKAVLVQKEAHLLELARYIVLNPLRAGMAASVAEWHWSSHRFMLDPAGKPDWLETQWLLGQFGPVLDHCVEGYRQFVAAGSGVESPLRQMQYQLVLGDDGFVAQHRSRQHGAALDDVARSQRRIAAMTLAQYKAGFAERDEAMARAYFSTAFTMAEIGMHFGVTYKTVSRAVSRYEGEFSRGHG
ncbi:MAG: Addiction module toxin RelE [Massilia sp.]|jgi:putative transposase|nr:Addiction module toxin RelE [Massilia sp.]